MICIVCSSIRYVVQHLLAGHTHPLCDSQQPTGTKSALGIDVQALSFTAAHRYRKLANCCQRVADLRLACAELPKELGDSASLDTTAEEGVQTLRSSRYVDELVTTVVHIGCTRETQRDELSSFGSTRIRGQSA